MAACAAMVGAVGCGSSATSGESERSATKRRYAEADASIRLWNQETRNDQLRDELLRLRQERAQRRARAAQSTREVRDRSRTTSSGSSASRSGLLLSEADQSSFDAFAGGQPGEVALAVAPTGEGGDVESLGDLGAISAWSTSKVPVAVAAIEAGVATTGSSDLVAAITASDNAAAESLWSGLGGGRQAADAADAALRAAGDQRTQMQSERLLSDYTPFGQTAWTVADQASFAAGLGCTASGREVLRLMGQTIPAQRWGLGMVGAQQRIKGGWGPGSSPGTTGGYLDRQLGVVRLEGRDVAIALAARPADGTHGTGTQMLTATARWAATHIDASAAGSGC